MAGTHGLSVSFATLLYQATRRAHAEDQKRCKDATSSSFMPLDEDALVVRDEGTHAGIVMAALRKRETNAGQLSLARRMVLYSAALLHLFESPLM